MRPNVRRAAKIGTVPRERLRHLSHTILVSLTRDGEWGNGPQDLLKAVSKGPLIELDFPLEPAKEHVPPSGLLEALGVSAKCVGSNRFDFLVEVESEAAVRGMALDFARLAQIEVRGVIVTARSDNPEYGFVSRFFAPSVGVNEDPVTGSAHCCLGRNRSQGTVPNYAFNVAESPVFRYAKGIHWASLGARGTCTWLARSPQGTLLPCGTRPA